LVRTARQANRGDQVGQGGNLTAGGRVACVHRVPGREHHDQAAGPGQAQRLDDEVAMDRVPAGVVPLVTQYHLPERHVPDRHVVGALSVAGVGERLGADLRLRVQGRRDARSHRVQFDPGHPRAWWGEGNEVS
jgi:hypothetical protein